MKTAVIYARFSSDNQRSESIDAQERACKEYAQKEGIKILRSYTDEAASGRSDDRPAFLRMIDEAKHHEFDLVIVHKLDRFARDRYDSVFYRRQLKKHGVSLVSVLERIDDSPEGIILESVIEGYNEYYSRNLAREVMKGLKENALQCKHTGGTPPLGYDVAPDLTYVINENEAESVRIIFRMYAEGFGYGQILDALAEARKKTKRGLPFKRNSLHDLLRNEKYIGVYTYNKAPMRIPGQKRGHRKHKPKEEIIRIEGGIPAIIDRDTWDRVVTRMESGRRFGSSKAKRVYVLSGVIYCGICGSPMYGSSGLSKGRRYSKYTCRKTKQERTCTAKTIRKEVIEDLVIDYIHENILSPTAREKIVERFNDYLIEKDKTIPRMIKEREAELRKIRRQIQSLVEVILDGMYNPTMKSTMTELENKERELKENIREIEKERDQSDISEDSLRKYLSKIADIKEIDPADQKKIVQVLVHRVDVHPDGCSIEVYSFDTLSRVIKKLSIPMVLMEGLEPPTSCM